MTDPQATPFGRIAGVDYGTVRIGIAVTNASRTLSSPLENYQRQSPSADANFFCRLVQEESIVQFVVGLPVHLSGDESGKSVEARAFGQWLQETTGISVAFFDERFTSSEAEQWLAQGKLTSKQRKARRDKLAAQIMLAAFLEAGQPKAAEPRGLDDRK